jgi:hypothetical protein
MRTRPTKTKTTLTMMNIAAWVHALTATLHSVI